LRLYNDKKLKMRTAFISRLTELATKDSRIMLVVGDLGFGVVTEFAKRFPKQFLNIGVAEQNMAGVAAGLALSGKIVFTYSIANFPILRCLEQIRNDICYHNANVISVSVGSGFCYGSLGMTHHGTKDIAIMRSLPYMNVIAPGDPKETQYATDYFAEGHGPGFLRLGRAGEPIVHENEINWQFGKAIKLRNGKDLTIIATGSMLKKAVETADILKSNGLHVTVLSMHTIKPLDENAILEAANSTPRIVTLEEHSIHGGLGGAVAEVLLEKFDAKIDFRRFGLPSEFTKHVGSHEYLLQQYQLTPEQIANNILFWILNKKKFLVA
jgi:transketolase